MFSKDGNYLYTGGRKDPYILCWDIRKAAEVVYKFYRSTEDTNQRILFDIEPCGRHLGTGGQVFYLSWSPESGIISRTNSKGHLLIWYSQELDQLRFLGLIGPVHHSKHVETNV